MENSDREFIESIEGDIEDLDRMVKDKVKVSEMAWEIMEIQDRMAMLKRSEKKDLRIRMEAKFPRAMTRVMLYREA